ncbi:site-specific integrase [Nitratireductor rhodophyticola]|uniref:site-specific integrase n=1 Tax=Nitratireductor rhodophyticola TaxID=2854036 RepID=UPI003BAB5FAD
MGTIVTRQRKDGTKAFLAKISIMREGKIVHRENKTFDRRPAAAGWISKREEELAKPGALERVKKDRITLADAIDKYTTESFDEIGRTKAQVLRSIKRHKIADMKCESIESRHISEFASDLVKTMQPQTVGNYLSHLAAVFAVARPLWGYELDKTAMDDAQTVLRRIGVVKKSTSRDRRPTLDELDLLMRHFADRQTRAPQSNPMHRIIAFAIFSTRRQEEIIRIRWDDLDTKHSRIMVRDMKHPGSKIGNHVWCDLPEEALKIIEAMPKSEERIFPYNTDAISSAFTRACKLLSIEDLRFHDLRHEGVSRLFEIGLNIPHVAAVSGHRSWTSLKRYTHMNAGGDKYEGWEWLPTVTAPMQPRGKPAIDPCSGEL